jgi:hemerythrin-like domain-containing protein
MKATARLKDEHHDITLMLQILEKICTKNEHGEKVKKTHLESMMEFFSTFVGKFHLAKEEELLFPAMEKAGVPKGGGPIGDLRVVHTIARSYISTLIDAVLAYPADLKKFTQTAREYIDLLKEHIDKEDILFPLAENYIPEERKKKLVEEFNKFEQTRIGPDKQAHFHKLLTRRKTAYL